MMSMRPAEGASADLLFKVSDKLGWRAVAHRSCLSNRLSENNTQKVSLQIIWHVHLCLPDTSQPCLIAGVAAAVHPVS